MRIWGQPYLHGYTQQCDRKIWLNKIPRYSIIFHCLGYFCRFLRMSIQLLAANIKVKWRSAWVMTRPLVSGAGIVMWGAEVWRAWSYFKHDYVENCNLCVPPSLGSNSPFKDSRTERNSKENSEDVRQFWHFLPRLPRATFQLSLPAMLTLIISTHSNTRILAVDHLILSRSHQRAPVCSYFWGRENSKENSEDVRPLWHFLPRSQCAICPLSRPPKLTSSAVDIPIKNISVVLFMKGQLNINCWPNPSIFIPT